MLVRALPRSHGAERDGRRTGAVATWLVFASGTFVALFAIAVNVTNLWQIRVEMQNACDAAALAAAATLVDDDTLRGNPALLPPLLQRSAMAGDYFAQLNLVQTQPFVLNPNPTNAADGDLIFGTLDWPRSRTFYLAQDVQDPTNASLLAVNAVQVTGQLSAARGKAPALVFGPFIGAGSLDVAVQSTAMLDRDVIGFRPYGEQPLLLAPLAIFSDPTGADPRSWQYQVESKNGTDAYTFNQGANQFVPGPDGIYELQAVLALDPNQQAQANVSVIFIGVSDYAGANQQLAVGMTSLQLQAYGGALLLGFSDNRLTVPGSTVGPAYGSGDANQLYQTLSQLQTQAAVRYWPMYCGTDGTGQPILCGFVAARVAAVTPIAANQPLTFVLQATSVSTPFAVNDSRQRGVGGIVITNPYICKVRVVQ